MADVGVEYVHIRALGNPKPYRDLYKSGRVEEGRRCYEKHLLSEQRGALEGLGVVPGDVPNAVDGWAVAEGAVGALLVVVTDPVWQRCAVGVA